MKKKDTFFTLILILLLIIFSPLILLILLYAGVTYLIRRPSEIRRYKNSAYFREFGERYHGGILGEEAYIFYNAAIQRNLNIDFHKAQDTLPDHFIYQNAVYCFPWFSNIFYSEEQRWEANDDGDWNDLCTEYSTYSEALRQKYPSMDVYVLVDRERVNEKSLGELPFPTYIHLVNSYEAAFTDDESAFGIKFPESTIELYQMMCETPELSGSFHMVGDAVIWEMKNGYRIELSVSMQDCTIEVYKGRFNCITHWHPDNSEIFREVMNIGLGGNVLVVRQGVFGSSVLYTGRQSDCPYAEKVRWNLGKIHRITAI